MKRILSNPLVALTAGLGLRLFFVLKFPANSGDTVLYEQIAANWLKHHAYAMDVGGAVTPVDLRMPGYPAFLAIIYAVTGRTGPDARLWVMLAQIGIDLLSCLLMARLAGLLASTSGDSTPNKRVYSAALWIAALCPFTANYTAVPLTEVFATFWTALACCALVITLRRVQEPDFLLKSTHLPLRRSVVYAALAAGIIIGTGTLFRPETPILLIAAVMVFGGLFFLRGNFRRWFIVSLAMGLGCLMVLSPWGFRNMVTLGEPQLLAPKYSNLPGELLPYGFMAWEKTWLYRVRDCYLVPWRLNGEAIFVNDLPARAFDTPEEKQRVAAILEQYNDELTLTAKEDAAFAQLARERNARHPLRTYLWLPVARAFTIWFTPRIELLPVSGHVFPLAQMREDDPVDQEVTSLFFLLNLFYVGLGIWGAVRLWHSNPVARPVVAFMALFILLRTAFLTTLETPEPRYVLVCFPALIAMGAQVFARQSDPQ
jgi:hypothetical protein